MRKSIAIIAALGLLSTGLTPVLAAPLHKIDDFSAAAKKKDEKAKDEKSKDKAKSEKKSQLGTTDFSAAAKKKDEKAEAKKKDEKKEDKKK